MHPLLILLIGIASIIGLMLVLRLNAFIALIVSAVLVSLLSPGEWTVVIPRVADAFGAVTGKIGIVIALAAVIGKCLMDSGAADRIVRFFLSLLGEKRAPWALLSSGYVLAIPVFYDTVFYLLVPLARSLGRSTKKHYMLYALAIACGAAITHTLVPPTPGPLIMASAFGIDLGLMILMGIVVALPTAALGLAVCKVLDRKNPVPMRQYEGQDEPQPIALENLPPLWLSFLPVLLPVLLITANTASGALQAQGAWAAAAAVLGNPNAALLLSAVIAMGTLVRYRSLSLSELAKSAEHALMSGGVIILITAAGGAFGAMLGNSGIQDWVKGVMAGEGSSSTGVFILLSGFITASIIKFAQGSGTVSMMTTSAMFAAMGFTAQSLGFHPVYLALAIGSGSLVGDWMNNSGFWIFARMCVFTEIETLKTWTVLTACMGCAGFVITVILSFVFPMV